MKKLSKEERKIQIIKFAMRLFAQKGFNGTTTKDIAKVSKVSEALLFKFFPRKSSLYSAIIEYRIKQMENFCNLQQIYKKKPEKVFREIVKSHIENIEKDDTFMRILLFSALEGHRLFREFYKAKIYKTTLNLANYIASKIKTGELKKVPPIFAARTLMGMTYNYLLSKKIFHIKDPQLPRRKTVAKIIVDIFLNGIQRIKCQQ